MSRLAYQNNQDPLERKYHPFLQCFSLGQQILYLSLKRGQKVTNSMVERLLYCRAIGSSCDDVKSNGLLYDSCDI